MTRTHRRRTAPERTPGERTAVLWKSQPDGLREHDTSLFDVPVSPPVSARGLLRDGTIRTTGWLQVGPWAVSSGMWAAVLGLAAGTLLVP